MERFDAKAYQQRVNERIPRSRTLQSCLRAFWTGGLICCVGQGIGDALRALFARETLMIEKRTKRKQLAQVDIAPMIRDIAFAQEENLLRVLVTVQAQNPGLNPQLLEKAIARYLPELTPDFVRVRRRQLLDADGRVFR